jgi:hypothetical protein
MVMDVSGAVMIGALFVLAILLVGVDQRRVIVLMLMVMGSMLELAHETDGVVVGHVVVVVGVNVGRVRMLVLFVAHHALTSRRGRAGCARGQRRSTARWRQARPRTRRKPDRPEDPAMDQDTIKTTRRIFAIRR